MQIAASWSPGLGLQRAGSLYHWEAGLL